GVGRVLAEGDDAQRAAAPRHVRHGGDEHVARAGVDLLGVVGELLDQRAHVAHAVVDHQAVHAAQGAGETRNGAKGRLLGADARAVGLIDRFLLRFQGRAACERDACGERGRRRSEEGPHLQPLAVTRLIELGANTKTSRGAAPMRPSVSTLPMLWLPHEGAAAGAPSPFALLNSCARRSWNSILIFSLAIFALNRVSTSSISSPAKACAPAADSAAIARDLRISVFIAVSPSRSVRKPEPSPRQAWPWRWSKRMTRSTRHADALGRGARQAGGGVQGAVGEDRRVLQHAVVGRAADLLRGAGGKTRGAVGR